MKGYTLDEEELEYIYNRDNIEDSRLRNKSIVKFRTKTIKAGDFLEVECFPVWNTNSDNRKARQKKSTESQSTLNHKNKVKRCIRLMNCNFVNNDTYATLTYDEDKLPSDYESAMKQMKNYIRRLKNYAKKNDIELKYIYTTEVSKKGRFHHHLVVNIQNRDVVEDLWKNGKRTNTKRLKSDESGYAQLASYITKETKHNNKQSYCCSKNLKKPTVTTSDYKVSRAQARKIATGRIDPVQFFQKLYKNYVYDTSFARTSDYVDGCYLYVKMHRFRN